MATPGGAVSKNKDLGGPSGGPLEIPPFESGDEFLARIASEDALRTATANEPRHNLLLSSWLSLELPARDYLLGNILCTTSRWMVFGETGVGKTLFALDLAGAVASGKRFLAWEGIRPARVMYLDGEMPAETFKERMELVAGQYGVALKLFGYNRDVLGDREMPPLNTEAGDKWLGKELDLIKPDLVIFDAIMSLLVGSMAEEESWAPIKPMIRAISRRRIAQIWLHHTGHDPTKAFGTKTREWEMDTVVAATKADDAGDKICIEFKKARLRTLGNREQFETKTIRRDPDGWTIVGSGKIVDASLRSQDAKTLIKAIVAAYDRLAAIAPRSQEPNGATVRKVSVDALRDEVKSRGFLDTDAKRHVTASSRTAFRRNKTYLIGKGEFMEVDGAIWRA